MVKLASTLSSRTFLLNFWFLPVFVVVIIVIRPILISYCLPMHANILVVISTHNVACLLAIVESY